MPQSAALAVGVKQVVRRLAAVTSSNATSAGKTIALKEKMIGDDENVPARKPSSKIAVESPTAK
jgi:hypothetical protein